MDNETAKNLKKSLKAYYLLYDFIGADLRDANLNGANLSTSMFLTQMQVNSAKGNGKTILPAHIQKPSHWND